MKKDLVVPDAARGAWLQLEDKRASLSLLRAVNSLRQLHPSLGLSNFVTPVRIPAACTFTSSVAIL